MMSPSFSVLIPQCCPLEQAWTGSCSGWASGRWDSVPLERQLPGSSWPTLTCVCLRWQRRHWSTWRMLTCAPSAVVGVLPVTSPADNPVQPRLWLKAFGELLQQGNQSFTIFFSGAYLWELYVTVRGCLEFKSKLLLVICWFADYIIMDAKPWLQRR